MIKRNPYRRGQTLGALLVKGCQHLVASIELALVLWVPPYRRRIQRRAKRPVDMMIVGAQKSGTTWVHEQLRHHHLAAVTPTKEWHHFDRGRMWLLSNYIKQFQCLDAESPMIEVAPDYGPMAPWRIRAVRAVFPEMKVAFIARNPVERAWSGTKMETGFDRGYALDRVPIRDFLHHMRLPRSRSYGAYADQISAWQNVFGRDRVLVVPFDQIRHQPQLLLAQLLRHVNVGALPVLPDLPAVFQGASDPMPDLIAREAHRLYGPEQEKLKQVLGPQARSAPWTDVFKAWKTSSPDTNPLNTELYVCGFAPNPHATSSGQKLAFRKIFERAAHIPQIRVLWFCNRIDALDAPAPDWPQNVMDLGPIFLRRRDRIMGAMRWPLAPSFVSARRWAARRVIGAQLRDPSVHSFYADFAQGLAAVPPTDIPLFTLRQHDIVSTLYDRQAALGRGVRTWAFRFETWRARRWERKVWRTCAQINTLSQSDCARIEQTCPHTAPQAEPVRGTIAPPTDPTTHSRTRVPGRIGFWGNMARQENVDAAQHLARHLLPEIQKRHPHATLWIVGAHPTADVRALARPDIRITGFVDTPEAELAQFDIAAVPLRLGSGVKIKVYETLDAGIPTIVSPIGGEGIPPHPLMHIGDTDDEIIDLICAAITQPPTPSPEGKAQLAPA